MTHTHDTDPLSRLQHGKQELRATRRAMTLPEKVAQVVELQKIAVVTISRRRRLTEIERVWPLDKG